MSANNTAQHRQVLGHKNDYRRKARPARFDALIKSTLRVYLFSRR